MPVHRFSVEEEALLRAVRGNPGDVTARLVFADWLEERGRPVPAQFLRLWASLPTVLTDGDTDADREELARQLVVRTTLREMRGDLEPAWLPAVGDPGLVGEVVVTELLATACSVKFGIIVKETLKTVTVARLPSRLARGHSQDGWVRPVLPCEERWTELRLEIGGSPARKQPECGEFTNERRFERWRFWEGKDYSDYGD